MKKISIAIIIIIALSQYMNAQSIRQNFTNSNSWFIYTGTHKVSDKWGLHLEAQLRRSDFVADAQQLLLRGGINYHLNGQVTLTAGYAFVETYPYGKLPAKTNFPENRFWEQLQLKNQVGLFEWISRFRLEQRYVHVPVATTDGTGFKAGDAIHTNRFRLLNRFSIPFKGKTIADKSFYLSVYDEIMVNFGEKVGLNIFDQNRLSIGIGYKLPKVGRLEVGYLNQWIVKGDGKTIEDNNTLSVSLNSNIDFYKKNKN